MAARTRLPALAALLLIGGLALPASADKLLFSGEHAIRFSRNTEIVTVMAAGTGVAVVNGSAGGSALQTLELTQDFAQIDATVTDTPGIGIDEIHFDAVRVNHLIAGPNGNPGLFAPIFGAAQATSLALTQNTLPGAGTIRICNLGGCPSSIALDLSQTSFGVAVGPGVGGTFTAMTSPGPAQITVMGNPWTIHTTTVSYRTVNNGTGFFTSMGFVHGPGSNTGTTALSGGSVQLVSGTQTTSLGLAGKNDLGGQIARLTLTFAPEPGLLLLLGAGAVGMALLGRKRIQK